MRIQDRRRARVTCHDHLRRARAAAQSLLSVHPVARRNLEPGTTVWAHVPFEELAEWKLRPAVVVSRDGRTVQLRPITGALSRLSHDRYLEIGDLEPAGLERPCAISLRRVVELDLVDVVSVAGRLSDVDFVRLQVAEVLVAVIALPSVRSLGDPVSREWKLLATTARDGASG